MHVTHPTFRHIILEFLCCGLNLEHATFHDMKISVSILCPPSRCIVQHTVFWCLYPQWSSDRAGMPVQLLIKRMCKWILSGVFSLWKANNTRCTYCSSKTTGLISFILKGGLSQLMSWGAVEVVKLGDIQNNTPTAWVISLWWQPKTGMCGLTRCRHGLYQY